MKPSSLSAEYFPWLSQHPSLFSSVILKSLALTIDPPCFIISFCVSTLNLFRGQDLGLRYSAPGTLVSYGL